jgi:multiple sugar transport system ATP-binding protein
VSGGQIIINGDNVTWKEPSERGIGMVFQSYALYPQMTVAGNLSFGLRNARMPKAEIAKRVARAAEILQIEPLLNRKPAALSGGQRQRVAIGRALVRDVDVFLFDEPLSNLDAKLRADLRVEIKRLHQQLGNTMIYVTHDQVEAMTLADRIAIMKNGQVQQLDTPSVIYNRPVNKYVADFIGSPSMNFLGGQQDGQTLITGNDRIDLSRYDFSETRNGGQITLGVRPEHMAVNEAARAMPITQEIDVDLVEPMGSDTLIWTKIAGVPFRMRVDGQQAVSAGDRMLVGFDPARASVFCGDSERRL